MEYMEFLDAVCEYVNDTTDDVRVSVHSAVKNNGVKLSGLSFSRKDYNASPTIYMENYYNEYRKGCDICEIGDRLLMLYKENDLAVKIDMSFFDSFETVRDRIFLKLINRTQNTDFLKEVPFEPFMDLAMVAYVRISDKKIGDGIIMVRNEHVNMWGVDAKTVIDTAKANTHDHDDYSIRHISDVLVSMGSINLMPDAQTEESFPMYVVTNGKMSNGAAVLTMSDRLKEYSDVIGGDYYVIPSSVHELILFAKSGEGQFGDLDSMIREVNASSLGADDVLSDHAYLYSKKEGVLIF